MTRTATQRPTNPAALSWGRRGSHPGRVLAGSGFGRYQVDYSGPAAPVTLTVSTPFIGDAAPAVLRQVSCASVDAAKDLAGHINAEAVELFHDQARPASYGSVQHALMAAVAAHVGWDA